MDGLGLLVALTVTPASVQDRDAVPGWLEAKRAESARLANVLVDAEQALSV